MQIDQVVADAGYSSGESLQYCEDKNIDAWITNFGQYIPEREGFDFNEELNCYECTKEGGNRAILEFKGIKTDSKGYEKKSYRSSETDCGKCPLRELCCGQVTRFKKIEDSIHKPLYDKMHQKLTKNKAYHRRLIKRRSATVEPVLGTLINHMNLKRVNTRGMAGANKHTLMSALSYNLKKYMKFIQRKTQIKTMALQKPVEKLRSDLISILSPAFSSKIRLDALNSTSPLTNFASEN